MKTHCFVKRLTAFIIAFALFTAALIPAGSIVFAADTVDLGLTWPNSWPEGTPPQWALNATAEEQAATVDAFNTEYQRQLDMEYNLGEAPFGIGAWGNMVGVQCQGNDSSNLGNPFGQGSRKWAIMTAPFPGMAFSVKGQISKQVGPSVPALNNQLEWTDPVTGETRLYQTFHSATIVVDTDGENLTMPGDSPGLGPDAEVTEAIEYAFASSAWYNEDFGKPYNLGHCFGNGLRFESDVIYQEFFGNDSSGASPEANRGLDKAYGISYIAMNKKSDAAYVITDKMFNAWREKYWTLQSDGSYNKFGITGAPIANQFTENGIIYQEFENGVISCNPSTGEISDLVSNDVSVRGTGFSYTGYIKDGNKLYYLVPENVDITSFAPGFKVAENAVITPAADEKHDFTNPMTYTVTSESGRSETYSVTIYSEKDVTSADRAAAEAVSTLLEQMPAVIYRNTMDEAEKAKVEYDKLTFMQKLLVKNDEAMWELEERIAEIEKSPIRVTCVGDSITQGVGSNPESVYSYPAQMQRMLGDNYDVLNAGVGGTNAFDDRGSRYKSTSRYTQGKAFQPDIVIVALGTNDAMDRLWSVDNGPEVFRKDYKALIEEYLNLDSKPIVYLSLPMYTWDAPRHNNNVNGTIPIIKEIAEELGLETIDMQTFTTNHRDWFPDGLHPDNTSYAYVAEEYKKYVVAAGEKISDHSIDEISLDGNELDNFDPDIYNYTVKADSLKNLPVISAKYNEISGKTVTVSQPTADNPVARITVQSKAGMFGNAYTIRFTDSIVPEYIKGDVDGNGVVNVSDIMTLKNLIMNSSWTEDQLKRGDIDDNKTLNVSDMLSIKSIIMEG